MSPSEVIAGLRRESKATGQHLKACCRGAQVAGDSYCGSGPCPRPGENSLVVPPTYHCHGNRCHGSTGDISAHHSYVELIRHFRHPPVKLDNTVYLSIPWQDQGNQSITRCAAHGGNIAQGHRQCLPTPLPPGTSP